MPVFRSSSKFASFVALSVQESSTWLLAPRIAARLVGAAGAGGTLGFVSHSTVYPLIPPVVPATSFQVPLPFQAR